MELLKTKKGHKMSNVKKLSEITRDEWIVYNWLPVTGMGENGQNYILGVPRDPSESIRAGSEWDAWHDAFVMVNNAAQ